MSDTTTHLLLPYILAAQAQKHVTHNEALRILDGLVQLSVLDRDLTAPPGSPAEGDRDIVAARLDRLFTDLAITAGVHRWEFDSLAAALHFITAESPMHVAAFERADAEQRARLSAGFEAALRAHADPAGAVSFDSPYLVISAARAATV